jgi:hypothetical protein
MLAVSNELKRKLTAVSIAAIALAFIGCAPSASRIEKTTFDGAVWRDDGRTDPGRRAAMADDVIERLMRRGMSEAELVGLLGGDCKVHSVNNYEAYSYCLGEVAGTDTGNYRFLMVDIDDSRTVSGWYITEF